MPAYSPIVKAKQNDLKALSTLEPGFFSTLRPIVEVLGPATDPVPVDEQLQKLARSLLKYPLRFETIVDFYWFRPGSVTSAGQSSVIAGFEMLADMGVRITPSYGFGRDDRLWSQLRSVVRTHKKGFCFRVDADDLDDRSGDTWEELITRASQLQLRPADVDLLIDLRDIRGKSRQSLEDLVLEFLALQSNVSTYRSIIIAGSCALHSVAEVPKDGYVSVPREELMLWSSVSYERSDASQIALADYGIIHPEFVVMGPNKNRNAKIRYTAGTSIHYFRGHRLADPPKFLQYHDLARTVRRSGIYEGPAYSPGDKLLARCADEISGPGNLGTWVFADMSHHMTYVHQQVARLAPLISRARSSKEVAELIAS